MKILRGFFRAVLTCALVIAAGFLLTRFVKMYLMPDLSINLPSVASSASASQVPQEQLVFDASVYPYYDQLNDTQKTLYSEMYTCASSLDESFDPQVDVSQQDVETVFRCMMCDHPELFWLDNQYHYQYMEESGRIMTVSLTYNETADDIETSKAAFDHACNEILVQAQQYSSDYDKEKYVHDALIAATVYDLNASLNQSAYSAMVNGRTVCAGYARSFQYLMQQLNIPCYYVIGTSEGEDHAWNIVLIDGSFYNVDVTWDDCCAADDPYYFFNLDDASFNQFHTRAAISTMLPSCTSTLLAHKEDGGIYPYIRFVIPQ